MIHINFMYLIRNSGLTRFLTGVVLFFFAFNVTIYPSIGYAQINLSLPAAGSMVQVSSSVVPAMLKGVRVNPNDPFRLDFLVDSGESNLTGPALQDESYKLIKYFLASLTIPEKDLWVNLSPYEKNRITPQAFGQTEMGRDLLAQDYLLKQMTASLIYPESELGQTFWDKIYKTAYEKFGTTNIPINTFNKVWIVPQTAKIFTQNNTAYIVDCHLKVMLEEDYLAIRQNSSHQDDVGQPLTSADLQELNQLSSQAIRTLVLPVLEKEVNEGQNFALLRQVFHSLILAAWYKKSIRESVMNTIYVDQAKIEGVDVEDKNIKEKIYQQYLEAFKKGVYNYIKEEYDSGQETTVPRKYFSGGVDAKRISEIIEQVASMSGVKSIGQVTTESVVLVPHRVVNRYIAEHLPVDLKQNKGNIVTYEKMGAAYLVPIFGLLANTGQFAHVGLGQVYGQPVVYIDEKYVNDANVRQHELDEIAQWEALAVQLGKAQGQDKLSAKEMRQWITNNFLLAQKLSEEFHRKSHSIEQVFSAAEQQGLLPEDVSQLYPEEWELAKGEQAINIAAGGNEKIAAAAPSDLAEQEKLWLSTPEQLIKENKRLIIADNTDAVDAKLYEQARKENIPYLRVTIKDQSDLDRLNKVLKVDDQGGFEHVDGLLVRFLKTNKKGILLIDYNGSDKGLAVGFHDMFANQPRYADVTFSNEIQVFGVLGREQIDEYDSSFTSRLRHRTMVLDEADPVDQMPKANIPVNAITANVMESPFIREELIEDFSIGENGKFVNTPGKLVQAMLEDRPLVLRGADLTNKNLRHLLRQVLLRREVEFNGETIKAGDHFAIFIEEIKDYSAGVANKELTRIGEKTDQDDEIWLINHETQDRLLKMSHIGNERIENQLVRQPGILEYLNHPEKLKNERLNIRITSRLDDWVWHAIMHAEGKVNIEVAPWVWVTVPAVYKNFRSGTLSAKTAVREEKSLEDVIKEKTMIIDGEDPIFIQTQVENLLQGKPYVVYPATAETTMTQLFEYPTFSTVPGGKRRYESVKQDLYNLLLEGQTVVLTGLEHNEGLLRELESAFSNQPYLIINGERVALPGKLIVIKRKQLDLQLSVKNAVTLDPSDEAVKQILETEFKDVFSKEDYARVLELRELFAKNIPVPAVDKLYLEEPNFHLQRLRNLFEYRRKGYTWLEAFESNFISHYRGDEEITAYLRCMVRTKFDVEDRDFGVEGTERPYKSVNGTKLSNVLNKTGGVIDLSHFFWQVADTLSLDLLQKIGINPSFKLSSGEDVEKVFYLVRQAQVVRSMLQKDQELEEFYHHKFSIYKNKTYTIEEAPLLYEDARVGGSETWQDRGRMVEAALDTVGAVMLKGPQATGKSYIAELMGEKYSGYEVFSLTTGSDVDESKVVSKRAYQKSADGSERIEIEDETIAKWAKCEKGILIVDEANLTDPYFWNFLKGFFSKNPYIWINGTRFELRNHKIIFTGNQETLPGRKYQELIEEYMPTVYFTPFTRPELKDIIGKNQYIEDSMPMAPAIRELLLDLHFLFVDTNPSIGFSLRDIQDLTNRIKAFMTDEVLQERMANKDAWEAMVKRQIVTLAWDVYNGNFNREEREALHHKIIQKFGVNILYDYEKSVIAKVIQQNGKVINSTNGEGKLYVTDFIALLIDSYQKMLSMREWRVAALKAGKKVLQGKQAMITEGPPGRGKDVTLIQVLEHDVVVGKLEQQGYREMNLSDSSISEEERNGKRYYVVNAQPDNTDHLVAVIERAKEEGAIVIVREANILPTDFLERFNDVLTGNAQPGFLLFATINSPDFSGRQKFSTALQNRVVYKRAADYTQAELLDLAQTMVQDENLTDPKLVFSALKYAIQIHVWMRAQIKEAKHRPTFRELEDVLRQIIAAYQAKGKDSFKSERIAIVQRIVYQIYGPLYLQQFLDGRSIPPVKQVMQFKEPRLDEIKFLETLGQSIVPRALGRVRIAIIKNRPDKGGGHFQIMKDENGQYFVQISIHGEGFSNPAFLRTFFHEISHGLFTRNLTPWMKMIWGGDVGPLMQDLEDLRHEAAFRHYFPYTSLGRMRDSEKDMAIIIVNKNVGALLDWMANEDDPLTHRKLFQLVLLVYAKNIIGERKMSDGNTLDALAQIEQFAQKLEKDGLYTAENNPIRIAMKHFSIMKQIKEAIPKTLDEEEIQFQQYRGQELMRKIRHAFEEIPVNVQGDIAKPPSKSDKTQVVDKATAKNNLKNVLENSLNDSAMPLEDEQVKVDEQFSEEELLAQQKEVAERLRELDKQDIYQRLTEMLRTLMVVDKPVNNEDISTIENRLRDPNMLQSIELYGEDDEGRIKQIVAQTKAMKEKVKQNFVKPKEERRIAESENSFADFLQTMDSSLEQFKNEMREHKNSLLAKLGLGEELTEAEWNFILDLPNSYEMVPGTGGSSGSGRQYGDKTSGFRQSVHTNEDEAQGKEVIELLGDPPPKIPEKVTIRRSGPDLNSRDERMQEMTRLAASTGDLEDAINLFVLNQPQLKQRFTHDGIPVPERFAGGYPPDQSFVRSGQHPRQEQKQIVICGDVAKFRQTPVMSEFIHHLKELNYRVTIITDGSSPQALEEVYPGEDYKVIDIADLYRDIEAPYLYQGFRYTLKDGKKEEQPAAEEEGNAAEEMEETAHQQLPKFQAYLDQAFAGIAGVQYKVSLKVGSDGEEHLALDVRIDSEAPASIFLTLDFSEFDLRTVVLNTLNTNYAFGIKNKMMQSLLSAINLEYLDMRDSLRVDPIALLATHPNHEKLKVIVADGREQTFKDVPQDLKDAAMEKEREEIEAELQKPGYRIEVVKDNGEKYLSLVFYLSLTAVPDVSVCKNKGYLKEIWFPMGSKINDYSGLTALRRHPNLRRLGLPHAARNIEFLRGFQQIENINMMNTQVGDISPLYGLKNLAKLDTLGNLFSLKQVGELYQRHPHPEKLEVYWSNDQTFHGYSEFKEFMASRQQTLPEAPEVAGIKQQKEEFQEYLDNAFAGIAGVTYTVSSKVGSDGEEHLALNLKIDSKEGVDKLYTLDSGHFDLRTVFIERNLLSTNPSVGMRERVMINRFLYTVINLEYLDLQKTMLDEEVVPFWSHFLAFHANHEKCKIKIGEGLEITFANVPQDLKDAAMEKERKDIEAELKKQGYENVVFVGVSRNYLRLEFDTSSLTAVPDLSFCKNKGYLTEITFDNESKIKDFSRLADLYQHPNLTWISLPKAVRNIEFLKGFHQLQGIELENTEVRDISPLYGLKSLNKLNIAGSILISIDQVEELYRHHPDPDHLDVVMTIDGKHTIFSGYSEFKEFMASQPAQPETLVVTPLEKEVDIAQQMDIARAILQRNGVPENEAEPSAEPSANLEVEPKGEGIYLDLSSATSDKLDLKDFEKLTALRTLMLPFGSLEDERVRQVLLQLSSLQYLGVVVENLDDVATLEAGRLIARRHPNKNLTIDLWKGNSYKKIKVADFQQEEVLAKDAEWTRQKQLAADVLRANGMEVNKQTLYDVTAADGAKGFGLDFSTYSGDYQQLTLEGLKDITLLKSMRWSGISQEWEFSHVIRQIMQFTQNIDQINFGAILEKKDILQNLTRLLHRYNNKNLKIDLNGRILDSQTHFIDFNLQRKYVEQFLSKFGSQNNSAEFHGDQESNYEIDLIVGVANWDSMNEIAMLSYLAKLTISGLQPKDISDLHRMSKLKLLKLEDAQISKEWKAAVYELFDNHPHPEILTVEFADDINYDYADWQSDRHFKIGGAIFKTLGLSSNNKVGFTSLRYDGKSDIASLDLEEADPQRWDASFLNQLAEMNLLGHIYLPAMDENNTLFLGALAKFPHFEILGLRKNQRTPTLIKNILNAFRDHPNKDSITVFFKDDSHSTKLSELAKEDIEQKEINIDDLLVEMMNSLVDPVAALRQVRGRFKNDQELDQFEQVLVKLKDEKLLAVDKRKQVEDVLSKGDAFFLSVDSLEKPVMPQDPSIFNKGGIDLNPEHLQMQIEGDGIKIETPVNLKSYPFPIEGLTPIIIHRQPVADLRLLLGGKEEDAEEPAEKLSSLN